MKTSILLIALIALIVLFSGCVEQNIDNRIEQANYCTAKEECVNLWKNVPAQCAGALSSIRSPPLVNKERQEEIVGLLYTFCIPFMADTGSVRVPMDWAHPGVIKCEQGKCVSYLPEKVGDECENTKQCVLVTCSGSPRSICDQNNCICRKDEFV